MQIVSHGEFASNQNKYFKLAEKEPVLVTRKKANPVFIRVVPEYSMLAEDLLAINRGLDDIKQGRTYKMLEEESLDDFLARTGDV